MPEKHRHRRLWAVLDTTVVVALIGLLWFLFANDGVDQIKARTVGHAEIDDPVVEWLGAMRDVANRTSTPGYEETLEYLTGKAREQMQKADREAQVRSSGHVNPDWTLKKSVFGDPLMWSNAVAADVAPRATPGPKVEVVDGDHANVSLADGFVVRYARSGCFASDGAFEVVRRDGGWRIDALPSGLFRGDDKDRCNGAQLRTSWLPAANAGRGVAVSDTDGLPRWAGDRLQRATPTGATAVPATATAATTASVPTLPQEAIDPENRSGPPSGITAWRTRPGAALGTEISFDLGAPVRLARIRLYNGVLSAGYREHGRIAAATIMTNRRQVAVELPDTPDLVTVDCDFGVTQEVRLRIDAVFPGAEGTPTDSDVALSDVSFWGEPPPRGKSSAGGAAVASRTLPAYHRACPALAGR